MEEKIERKNNELWTEYLFRYLEAKRCNVKPIEIKDYDAEGDIFWIYAGTELETGKGKLNIRRVLDFKNKLASPSYDGVMDSKPFHLLEWINIEEDGGNELCIGFYENGIDTIDGFGKMKGILSKYNNNNFKGNLSEIIEDVIQYINESGTSKIAIKKRNQRKDLSSKLKNGKVEIPSSFNVPEDFSIIDRGDFFGFIKKDYDARSFLEEIIHEGEGKNPRTGWNVGNTFVKKLGTNEMKEVPARRFVNSIHLYNHYIQSTPEPIGLIYSGNWVNLMTGNSDGYFIAENIEGNTLMNIFGKLNDLEKQCFFDHLGNSLSDIREHEHSYLMDFAPRDIIYNARQIKGNITLVDTEHVESAGDLRDKIGEEARDYLLQKQVSQFKEDYSIFLNKKELHEATKRVFR